MTILINYVKLCLVGDEMDISRITFLSQFVVPMLEKKEINLVKDDNLVKVSDIETTSKNDNDTRKDDNYKDPMYFYELEQEKSKNRKRLI